MQKRKLLQLSIVQTKAEGLSSRSSVTVLMSPKTKTRIIAKPERGMKMRVRQIERTIKLIHETLMNIETSEKKTESKEFVTPNEQAIRKKRWNEYIHPTGRTLYVVQTEIAKMRRTLNSGEKVMDEKMLRTVASTSRSLLHVLQGLLQYLPFTVDETKGRLLQEKLLHSASLLFQLLSTIGFDTPDIKKIEASEERRKSLVEKSEDSSGLEISSSDLNSTALPILEPNAVRTLISKLAHTKLKNNWSRTGKQKARRNKKLPPHQKQDGEHSKSSGKKKNHNIQMQSQHTGKIRFSSENRKVQENNAAAFPGKWKEKANVEGTASFNNTKELGETHFGKSSVAPKERVIHECVNEERLANKTASTVLHKLQPLFQKQHDPPKEQVVPSLTVEEPKEDDVEVIQGILTELSDRMKEIEFGWKRAQKMVEEEIQEQQDEGGEDKLSAAVLEAKKLLTSLQTQQPRSDSHYKSPIAKGKWKGTHLASSFSRERTTVYDDDEYVYPAEELPTIESQLQRQKESFWAGLIEAGLLSKEDAEGTLKGLEKENFVHRNDPRGKVKKDGKVEEKPMEKPFQKNTGLGEASGLANRPKQTNSKREEFLKQTSKETQVGSSLTKSYSSSFISESTQDADSNYSEEQSVNRSNSGSETVVSESSQEKSSKRTSVTSERTSL
ncbi:uncharacterized protein LOC143021462 isoform X2 [Oratosquilla oratoria]